MTGQRRALIVAGDEYDNPGLTRLLAPAADAEALRRVLGDPQIGDFGVEVVRNAQAYAIQDRVEALFSAARLDDVLLLHFSCHGLKSESGELFFAARNTVPTRLRSTAVSADFVQHCMRDSRSRTIVVLLDCCFGGAFSKGVTVRASADMNVLESFRTTGQGHGRGRAVITASSAMEYAFEADGLVDSHVEQPSVFTSALVEGLATGDADLDKDGLISLDELYDYVYERVRERNPHQTPTRDIEMQGNVYVAHSRGRVVESQQEEHDEAPPVTAGPRVQAGSQGSRWPLLHIARWRLPVVIGVALVMAITAVALVMQAKNGNGNVTPPTPSNSIGLFPITLPKDQMVVPEIDPGVDATNLKIIRMSPPGDMVFRIVNGEKPTLSPDRQHILFVRKALGSDQPVPYIMDANRNNLHPFIRAYSSDHPCQYSGRPAWSPSGKRVAMVCFSPAKVPDPQISFFNAGGVHITDIPIAGGLPNGFLTWVGNDSVIFDRRPDIGDRPQNFYSLWQLEDVFGKTPEPVEITKSWKPGSYSLPDWSKAHGLLFQRKPEGFDVGQSGYVGVWNMDPQQKPPEAKLPHGRSDVFRGASWSPDGKKVVFWWLSSRTEESLSWTTYKDLNKPNNWHRLSVQEGAGGEPPGGKAQPAWGTL
jgi:hypothetical protein